MVIGLRGFGIGLAALLSAFLVGCESVELGDGTPGDTVDGRPLPPGEEPPPGLFGSASTVTFGDGGAQGVALPVNKYLWRATLDTLAFLPLASTDPYGGVIVTEWGSTPVAPDERFKVTAYIVSATLKPQSLRVVVNKEQRTDAGDWVTAQTSPETARKLENAILTRARQLRIEAGDADE